MLGIGTHVGTPVPATRALGVGRRRDVDPQLTGALVYGRTRDDQHESQIIAQAAQDGEVFAACIDIELGLQRRADLAFAAHVFELTCDFGPDFAHP